METENGTEQVVEAVEGAPEAAEAPVTEPTAAPGTETEQPEVTEAPKTFTQEELDAIVAKRLARAERQWKREAQPAFEPQGGDSGLSPEQIISQYEAHRQQREAAQLYEERAEAVMEKYDDFSQVAYNPNLPVSDHMALAIQTSEQGPEILYWLGSNPKEAQRISGLNPFLQAKEIGRIEANLAANPPAKKVSSAPAPITPVTPRANGGAVETTDPRSIDKMSTSEWIAAERQRQIRKMSAQQ